MTRYEYITTGPLGYLSQDQVRQIGADLCVLAHGWWPGCQITIHRYGLFTDFGEVCLKIVGTPHAKDCLCNGPDCHTAARRNVA